MSIKKRLSRNVLVVSCIVALSALTNAFAADGTNISPKFRITQPAGQNDVITAPITEALGLALSHAGKSHWTVSDNKSNVVFS